jgi:AmmeMemoRadiSam system protein B
MIAPIRPPQLAGAVYSHDPAQLERFLTYSIEPRPYDDRVVGIVSPHIDYNRGILTYGSVYGALHGAMYDKIIVLGTSHYYGRRYLVMTKQHFATPLGVMFNDLDTIEYVANRFGTARAFDEELRHHPEHSIELQVPFIQARGFQRGAIPILVGSFHEILGKDLYPENIPEYDEFMHALCEGIQRSPGQLGVVVGVDLAHIGEQFGDTFVVDEQVRAALLARDTELLGIVGRADKHTLFQHISEDDDQRRVCGFSPLYVFLDLMDRLGMVVEGEVIDYRQAVDPAGKCCVSIASLIYRIGAY